MAKIVTFLTSGTTWTVPSDFSIANIVEVIGAGGGNGGSSGVTYVFGGGGGGYAKNINLSLTPGANITYQVGQGVSGGAGTDTWFNGASLVAATLGATGGAVGYRGNTSSTAVAAGGVGSGSGATTYTGGSGGKYLTSQGGGGGGAAGLNGNGNNGSTTSDSGGSGDAGFGGAAGGGNGTEWDGTHGSGGGGNTNQNGGQYGAGAGGGTPSATIGGNGLIVITYWTPTIVTMTNITFAISSTLVGIVSAISIATRTFLITGNNLSITLGSVFRYVTKSISNWTNQNKS